MKPAPRTLLVRFIFGAACPLLAMVLMTGCRRQDHDPPAGERPENAAKIELDLAELNDEGLKGPPDGLRAVSYEFCIPNRPEYEAEVWRIDPKIAITHGARGRIGCRPDQALCIGSTHQPEFRLVLFRLAALPYVERIVEAHFE
jgi:hypothetical protein